MSDVTERMQEIARTVQTILPPHTGYVVLAFDFHPPLGRVEYVSNGKREDVLKAMCEFIVINQNPEAWAKHLP